MEAELQLTLYKQLQQKYLQKCSQWKKANRLVPFSICLHNTPRSPFFFKNVFIFIAHLWCGTDQGYCMPEGFFFFLQHWNWAEPLFVSQSQCKDCIEQLDMERLKLYNEPVVSYLVTMLDEAGTFSFFSVVEYFLTSRLISFSFVLHRFIMKLKNFSDSSAPAHEKAFAVIW